MSFTETLVILVVAMIVLGPKKLPSAARKVGHWMGMLRRASDEFKRQVMSMDQQLDDRLNAAAGDLDALAPTDEELAKKLHPIDRMPDLVDASVSFVRQLSEAGVIKLTRSPHGRDPKVNGNPFDVVKTLGKFDIAYLARGSVSSPANVIKSQKMIKKALEKQMRGEGFCLVEILSPCPTNWGFADDKAYKALEYMKEHQEKFYELGEFIDKGGEKA